MYVSLWIDGPVLFWWFSIVEVVVISIFCKRVRFVLFNSVLNYVQEIPLYAIHAKIPSFTIPYNYDYMNIVWMEYGWITWETTGFDWTMRAKMEFTIILLILNLFGTMHLLGLRTYTFLEPTTRTIIFVQR